MTRTFTVLIEQGEDGVYVATVPALKSCYTQADSIPELLEKVHEVIELCLEDGFATPTRGKLQGSTFFIKLSMAFLYQIFTDTSSITV